MFYFLYDFLKGENCSKQEFLQTKIEEIFLSDFLSFKSETFVDVSFK